MYLCTIDYICNFKHLYSAISIKSSGMAGVLNTAIFTDLTITFIHLTRLNYLLDKLHKIKGK